jgi:YidC/Oxa1 family membrane protein insertase
MDTRRTILLMVFMVSVFLLWDAWMRQGSTLDAPSQAAASKSGQAESPNAGTTASGSGVPSAPTAVPVPTISASPPPAASTIATGASGAAGQESAAAAQRVVLQNKNLLLEVDPQGARIVRAVLLTQESSNYPDGLVQLFSDHPAKRYEAQTGLVSAVQGQTLPPNHTMSFSVVPPKEGQDPDRIVVLVAESAGLKLTKTIAIEPEGHQVRVAHTILNTGADTASPSLYLQLMRNSESPPGESAFYMTFTGPAVYTEQGKFQKIDFSDIDKGKQNYVKQASDGWIGIVQHYFVSAWLVNNQSVREFFTRRVDTNLYTAGMIQPLPAIAPGAQQSHEAILYVGPQEQRVLEALAPGLDLVVDYGWLTVLAKPIYWLLEQLYGLVNNWGWAIVLLTIVIKLVFYPLSAASYRSMAKMKAVSPRLMQIRERYVNDKAKMNQAMMELYRNEKINPLGGCLPVLIQIPVFIALYLVLLASVEMRNAPWVLWIEDLSSPDPFYILPVVMAITMFVQMKLNPPPPDPVQAKVMMLMPLIFSVFFFFFPAGLVLYWLVNNLVSIAQQWHIMRRVTAGS